MEVGNVQQHRLSRTPQQHEERRKDMEAKACCKCHEVGYRPWKHSKETVINPQMDKEAKLGTHGIMDAVYTSYQTPKTSRSSQT